MGEVSDKLTLEFEVNCTDELNTHLVHLISCSVRNADLARAS